MIKKGPNKRYSPREAAIWAVFLCAIFTASTILAQERGGLAQAAEKKLTKLKFGMPKIKFDNVFDILPSEKGFMREEGLEIEYVDIESSATIMKALVAGQLDVSWTSPAEMFIVNERGADLRIIGSHKPGLPHYMFVRKEINKLEDLYDKHVAISQPGSLPHILTVALFVKSGLNPDRLKWVSIGGSGARTQALIAGKIDGAINSLDFLPAIEKDPGTKPLLFVSDLVPEYIRATVIASQTTIKEKPEALVGLLKALAKGVRYAIEHKEETVAMAARLAKEEPKEAAWAYDKYINLKLVNPNLYVDPTAIDFMQDLAVKIGVQQKKLPIEKVANYELQKRAIEAIGKYKF